MRACFHVEITTPKKVVLNGLWFGPKKAKRAIIFVHGLGGSTFSRLPIVDELLDKETAVVTFNNRGHDKVTYAVRGKQSIKAGAAHEKFIECIDDVEGAIRFAKASGAKEIFLAGHSTGCQKSIYWASKVGRGVKGIILLAPISDYAAEIKGSGEGRLKAGTAVAERMVRKGRGDEIMSTRFIKWSLLADAQRFVSLYSGKGPEEIFTYWSPKTIPKTLKSVKLPIIALLAEKDEYRDRESKKMAALFALHLKKRDVVHVIPKVGHGFKGGEKEVAARVRKFMKDATL